MKSGEEIAPDTVTVLPDVVQLNPDLATPYIKTDTQVGNVNV